MRLVPTKRLLWIAGLVLVPATTLWGLGGAWMALGLIISLGVIGFAVFDALISSRRLQGLSIEELPKHQTSVGRAIVHQVKMKNAAHSLTTTLAFPPNFFVPQPLQRTTPEQPVVEWTMTPGQRGRYDLTLIGAETTSALGLWSVRCRLPMQTEVRVYPDLRYDRRRLNSLFMQRSLLGMHQVPQLGKGREFDHLRDYQPGDDYQDIHWKTTARRGFPASKTYQIERTREIYVIIDHSRLSSRQIRLPLEKNDKDSADEHWIDHLATATQEGYLTGSREIVTSVLERCLQSCLILAQSAAQQQDQFGLVTFADQVTHAVKAGAGRSHYDACREAIFTLEAKPVSPNFEELFVHLRRTITRRSLLVFLTDLSDPVQAETFREQISLLSRQHLVLVCMTLGDELKPLFSQPEPPAQEDELYDQLAAHYEWHDLQALATYLRANGVTLAFSSGQSLATDVVTYYMRYKQRQAI
jgi:uncharacterized protein (DUF58 family)